MRNSFPQEIVGNIKLLKKWTTRLIKSKNASSALWSAMEAIIYPSLMLLATPHFLDKLGAAIYGIWMLVNTVVSSIGILNVGFGDATIKFVAQYRRKNDFKGVHKVIEATYSSYVVIAVFVIIASLVIGFLIRDGILLNGIGEYKMMVFRILPVAGATLSLKLIEQIFFGVFKGFDRYDIASKISIVGKIITILVSVVMVNWGYSLSAIFIGSFVVSFLFVLIECYLIFNFFGYNRYIPFFDSHYIKEVFKFGI